MIELFPDEVDNLWVVHEELEYVCTARSGKCEECPFNYPCPLERLNEILIDYECRKNRN